MQVDMIAGIYSYIFGKCMHKQPLKIQYEVTRCIRIVYVATLQKGEKEH